MPCKPRMHDARGPREALAMAALIKRWHVPMLGCEQTCMPWLMLEQDTPTLLLFTSRRKAVQMVNGWIAPATDIPVHAAAADPQAMAGLLEHLADRGIAWVRINHGPRSVRLPLEALAGGLRLASDIVCFAGQLWMLRDPITPTMPWVEICREEPCLRLFTSAPRARARAHGLVGSMTDDPDQSLVAMTPDDLQELLGRLRQQGVGAVVIEGPGGGRWMRIEQAMHRAAA